MPTEETKKTQCVWCTRNAEWICTKPTGEVCTPEECAEAECEVAE